MTALDGIWLARPEQPAPGTPVAVKDLLDTAGLVTTYGSILFAEHVPERSAEAVLRLEAAGYAVAGKTNLHEFAYGISSQNPHYGTVPNPRAPGRLAGGSSGGSAAAIAAGEVELALGTDSGGSIRIPAAWCGIVGFKPTFDLVPADGCFPLAPSYDHVGPMAATVEGCAELMRALVPGFAPAELESLEELEVGVAWLDDADPLVRARVEAAAALFPRRRRLDFPLAVDDYRLFMREVADVHRGLFPENADAYGDNVRGKLERCLRVTDGEVEAARRARDEYRERCTEALDGVDLLVTPTIGMTAPPADVDELAIRERGIRFTYPFDSLGWPALALPCGPAEDGLPASVQLAGRPGDDARILAAGTMLASLVRGTA
ncbi:MAG TPA: amidase, partial [Gaiellaceae bacterium]|nr:amidase [Gaiellaceae bacterium]